MSACPELVAGHAEYLNAEKTSISSIIFNYNAGSLLRKCVDSLLDCPLDIEIVVVDKASSDASLDELKDLSQARGIRTPAIRSLITISYIIGTGLRPLS